MSDAPAPRPPLTHGTSKHGRAIPAHQHDAASAPVLCNSTGQQTRGSERSAPLPPPRCCVGTAVEAWPSPSPLPLSIAARCIACKPALPVLDEGGHSASPADLPRSGLRVEGHALPQSDRSRRRRVLVCRRWSRRAFARRRRGRPDPALRRQCRTSAIAQTRAPGPRPAACLLRTRNRRQIRPSTLFPNERQAVATIPSLVRLLARLMRGRPRKQCCGSKQWSSLGQRDHRNAARSGHQTALPSDCWCRTIRATLVATPRHPRARSAVRGSRCRQAVDHQPRAAPCSLILGICDAAAAGRTRPDRAIGRVRLSIGLRTCPECRFVFAERKRPSAQDQTAASVPMQNCAPTRGGLLLGRADAGVSARRPPLLELGGEAPAPPWRGVA